MATTFTITEKPVRESIIADGCERLKVTASFSNGETRSFHFPLEVTPEEVTDELTKLCEVMDQDAQRSEEDAPRIASEMNADATADALFPTPTV